MKVGKFYKILFILPFWLFFFVLAPIEVDRVQAAGSLWDMQKGTIGEDTNVPKVFGETQSGVRDFRVIILHVIKIFFTFLGIICIGIILYAGFKWMNSRGDSGEIEEAKKYILRAVIGLFIILASIIMTDFALRAVQGVVDEEAMFWLF